MTCMQSVTEGREMCGWGANCLGMDVALEKPFVGLPGTA